MIRFVERRNTTSNEFCKSVQTFDEVFGILFFWYMMTLCLMDHMCAAAEFHEWDNECMQQNIIPHSSNMLQRFKDTNEFFCKLFVMSDKEVLHCTQE